MTYLKTLSKCWGIFLAAIGYGIIVSFLSINGVKQPSILVLDNTDYQNFAILIGAITGFGISTIGISLYYLLDKYDRANWYGLPLLFCSVSGILIGPTGCGVVNFSADSYGLINGSMGTFLVEGSISALFGGCLGWAVSIVVQEHI